MKQLIKYQTEKGNTVFIEVNREKAEVKGNGMRDVGALKDKTDKIISAANCSFEKSLESIYSMGEIVIGRLKKLEPHKVEVEFGVTFSAEAGAIITSVGAEANFKINLSWEKGKESNSK